MELTRMDLLRLVVMLGVFMVMAAFIANMGGIEERQRVVGECNEKLAAANYMLAKCQQCLYKAPALNISNVTGEKP